MADAAELKTCPFCAESILAVAKKCKYCGEYLDAEARRANTPTPSAMERMMVPVGRPASAIASGYLGLIGIMPMIGLPFSIAAIITGFVALKTLKKQPELSGAGRAWFGIICGIIGILGSLLLFVVIAVQGGRQRGF
ncbi:MAG: DUF4190 domain-containing protein [Planctomycetaceae bacterium]|nr:DUF4190 domain-containing protein [Planctomycetaceae bacterium]